MRSRIVFAILCAGLLFMKCVNATGGSTETSSKVASMLYNPGGTPAVSAKVYFRHHDNDPRPGFDSGVVDSTATDANGNYSVTLDPGTYTIEASGDSGLAYMDSVTVINDSTVRPDPDTLKPAGTIRGVVRLEEGGDPTTIFILFMGTRTFTWPDDTFGNFSSGAMAEGDYRVKILTTTPNYEVMDTSFMITAGIDSVLPQPIVMKYTGIPVPKELRIEYDTMKQIVTLVWNTPTTGRLVQSFTVYRKHSDSASFVNIKAGLVDTIYSDSTGVQDQTYEYRVAVVDTFTMEGVKSAGVNVTVLSGYVVVKTIDSINGTRVRPAGLFIYNGHLFVADSWAKEIIEMDLDGNFIKSTSLLNSPNDLVIDIKGNYWVAEFSSNQVQRFDSNWILQQTWSGFQNQAGDTTTAVTEPLRMTIDSNDNIYILYNSADFSVIEIDSQGIAINKWYIGGSNSNNISILKNHQLATSGGGSNVLTIYDSTGTFLRSVQLGIPLGTSDGIIENMAVDSEDYLYFNIGHYFSNPPPSRLYKFDTNGNLTARWNCGSNFQAGDMVISSSGDIFLGALFPGRIEIYSQRE
jgi:hypothetical protein